LQIISVAIAGVRSVQERLAIGKVAPGEIAAIDDRAADRRAVAADIFCGVMDDDRRSVFQRANGERRGGVVDD
jgi:hypothetical protein